jgi:tetratricopeptide (TPR) repeat protein
LLSADKAIVIPLIFIVYEFSQSAIKKNFKKLLTLSGISLGWLLIYISEIGKRVQGVSEISYSQKTGIENPLIQIPVAIGSYIKLILWPNDLTLYHSNLVFSQLEFIIFILVLLAIAGGIIYGYKKNRLIFFWLSFFIISLLPTLTPFKISWVIAERYVYMGTIGIFFLVGLVISRLFKDKETEIFGYGVLIIVLSLLMVRTIVRNNDWRNEDNLWISMANISSADPKTHNNLGDMYARHKQYDKAVEEFTKGIMINPNYADAYHNRGNTYAQMGKFDLALADYQKAIDINPKLWQSHQNIAAIFYSQKKYSIAIEHIKKAIDAKPILAQELSDLYANLATVQLTVNDKQGAVSSLNRALEISPQSERVKKMLQEINK